MVDEAHATGLYGSARRGLAEELGVAPRIEIQMGTLGKALGSSGGYICGPRSLIEYLINRARPFVFSTAPVPAAAAAATAGVRFVQSAAGEQRRNQLWSNVEAFHRPAEPENKTGGTERRHKPSAIIPIIIGDETRAMKIAAALREQGIFIPAIRYPTVGHGQARLRVTFSAAHKEADIVQLRAALQSALNFKP
jgi:7-keto-8-aminopelargonate synthetase-like enzyme